MLKKLLLLPIRKLGLGLGAMLLLGLSEQVAAQDQRSASLEAVNLWLQSVGTGAINRNQNSSPNQTSTGAARLMAQTRPLTSTVYYPDGNGNWLLNYHGRYTYDAMGNQTSYTRLPAAPQSLIEKDSSQFDLHGNQTFSASYTFHQPSNSWLMNWGDRSFLTYNGSGLLTEQIEESWNNGFWEKDTKITSVYNAAGFPTEQVNYEWVNNTWVPEEKVIFTYGAPTAAPTGLMVQAYNNGTWANQLRFQNIVWHNIQNFEMVSYEAQAWAGAFWLNLVKSNAVYDPFGGSVTITQNWNGLAWENSEKETEIYDNKMNRTGRRSEVWQNNAWALDSEYAEALTYNNLDQITERILSAWDPSSNTIKAFQKEVYNSFLVMGAGKRAAFPEVTVFPNPATSYLMVQQNSPEIKQAQLTDLTGRLLLNLPLHGPETRLELTGLAPGTYLLQLRSSKENRVQKIVKR